MDKTPIKVYEDKELIKTPQSGIKRVLNITPANPLSPKDVNIQTPLIFKPKKLQIPEIFSPISKIKSLPERQRYTTGNNENWEDLEIDDARPYNDAVTSTPIVPKRNRNYYNCLKITPKSDKNNFKIVEKKGSNDKINGKCNARKANTNTNDMYSLRRRKMKENLANELKAVLHKKQLKHEIDKKIIQNLQPDNNERKNTDKPATSDSFEELKARFERLKSKAANTVDKSPSYNHTESIEKDTNKPIEYNGKEILKRQVGDQLNYMRDCKKSIEDVKTKKPTPLEKSDLSGIEVSKQESGSNLNYYTAFPDDTNLGSSKQAVPPASIGGHLKYHGQKEFNQNDISGVQIIPNSLNVTPSENNGERKISLNNNSRNNEKPLTSKTQSLKEKNESKIPKLNIERSSKKKSPSILIRDEDIDRITYKLNLGPVRTLNSTSKEKSKFTGRNAAKVLSQPKNCIEKNDEHKIVDHCQHDPKVMLVFQSPVESIRQKQNEGLKFVNDALTSDHLHSVNPCKKVPINGKTKSEPKRKPSSFKISRQNKTETETYTRSSSSEGVSLSYNTRKRKISFTGKNTHSEVHNSKIRVTSQYKVTTCDRKISLQESVSFSRDQFIQKHSTHNFSESVKEFSELYNSQDENLSNHRDNAKPTFPQKENPGRVNSTFVIQNPSSCYDCHNSMPIIIDHSSPNSIVSSCSSNVVSETKTKSVKTSLGTFGECFKFRKKSTTYSRETKSNLKRSYSFVHISVKDNKLNPKSILDLHSLSQSFPKNSFYFSDTESSPLLSNDNFPKHSHKKRKPLKNLTKDHFQKKSLTEERREPLKENEEIYDEIDKKDIKSADVGILTEDQQDEESEAIYDDIKNKNIVCVDVHEIENSIQSTNSEAPHRIGKQKSEQLDMIESFRVSTDKYDLPNFHDNPSSQADSEVFKKRMNIKSVDIERDSLSNESENCVVLNDEFFKKTQKLVDNKKDLIDITKGVAKVENDLSDLSRLHSEIKEDLVIKWACPTPLKSSSSSDNISEGNDSVKNDGDDVDSRIPSRNAASGDKSVNIKAEKKEKRIVEKISREAPHPQIIHIKSMLSAKTLEEWTHFMTWLYSKKIKSQLLTSKVIGSSLDKQRDRDSFSPSPPPLEAQKIFNAAPKQSRISSPLKSRTDRFQRDEYRVFLEEQNYRAIQMIESRMTRVEEKLSSLQSVTLDIRKLLQAKLDNPAWESKVPSSPQVPMMPPPPPPPLPPPPPPPPSTEVFFFPLRSSTSYNSSLAGTRRKSSPRNKSLRPAITVDDLRSVTLRKVSKEQMQAKLKQTAM